MIRQIKIAKDTAVKARTQVMVTLKTLIVTAADELRGLARRGRQLQAKSPTSLTTATAPTMVAAFGIGSDTAAEMLIVAGDNTD